MHQRDYLAEYEPPEYENQLPFPTIEETEAEADRKSHLFLKATLGTEAMRLAFKAGWMDCEMAHVANLRVYLAEAVARAAS